MKPDIERVKIDFSKAAKKYDQHAQIQREVADYLLSRLDYQLFEPETILDLGCGTGYMVDKLQQRYPNSKIIGLDLSIAMCQKAKQNSAADIICADINNIPLKNNSIDLVVSNFTFQWCHDLPNIFSKINRLVRPEAVFLFSTVAAGSLREMQQSWAKVDNIDRVNTFDDMLTIGDALYASGWQEPVMDIDRITKYYSDVMQILYEFKALGVTNKSAQRNNGLTGKAKFQKFVNNYSSLAVDNKIPLSWEIAYGFARKAKGVKFTI